MIQVMSKGTFIVGYSKICIYSLLQKWNTMFLIKGICASVDLSKYIISNQRVAVARILSWRDSRTDFRPPSDAESSAVKDGETAAEQN